MGKWDNPDETTEEPKKISKPAAKPAAKPVEKTAAPKAADLTRDTLKVEAPAEDHMVGDRVQGQTSHGKAAVAPVKPTKKLEKPTRTLPQPPDPPADEMPTRIPKPPAPKPTAPRKPEVDMKVVESLVTKMLDDRAKTMSITLSKEIDLKIASMLKQQDESMIEMWDTIHATFLKMWKTGAFAREIAKFNAMLRGSIRE